MATKVCNVCNKEKPTDLFYKNKTYTDGLTSKCKLCHNAQCRESYYDNKEHRINTMRKWSNKNRGHSNSIKAKYRAAKRNANVSWADSQYIKDLYENAKEASEIFGIEFQVDHIVPLQGETVSGLHLEDNLQILTKEQNCSKQNKWDDSWI